MTDIKISDAREFVGWLIEDTAEVCAEVTYLHDSRYHVPTCRIVKTVAISETKVTFETTWSDKWSTETSPDAAASAS